MVHIPLMPLSEWREFTSAPCLAEKKKSWWQLASRWCWNRARRLTCFLSTSVIRKDLQFSTWTDPSFQRHYRFRPKTLGSRSAKDLSARPRMSVGLNFMNKALQNSHTDLRQESDVCLNGHFITCALIYVIPQYRSAGTLTVLWRAKFNF